MKVIFIAQGVDPKNESTAGNFIIKSLKNSDYKKFNAFVAFVSTRGLKSIIDQIGDFKKRGGVIRLYVGVDLHGTSKEALEMLINSGIESYIVYSPNNVMYHPKLYVFEGDKLTRVIIGSSNLTEPGLFQHIEALVCIDFNNNKDIDGKKFLSSIYKHFNSIIIEKHSSCKKLTPKILDMLLRNKVVLPEKVIREKNNNVNEEFSQKIFKDHSDLLKSFGKIKPKKPPKGYKEATIRTEELIAETDETVNIVCKEIELSPGSMWIETGKMTGGSRNILDLSKAGRRDGKVKPGSVHYFGIDPNNETDTKTIDIHLGDKVYKENPIFFATGNKNWRIQLKGTSNIGEKLTTISKPGGFVNKILLFSKIDVRNFNLEIMDEDEMEKLAENSSDWAKSGRGRGRAYGFI